jgi:hypothetical protein
MAKRVAYAKSSKHEQLTHMDVPESFDSETNWPHCAKVIGDIRDQSRPSPSCRGPFEADDVKPVCI